MLDIYANARCTHATPIDAAKFFETCSSTFVASTIERYRNGDVAAKRDLPAVTYMGTSITGRRCADDMLPTGLVMLDVDHINDDRIQPLREMLMTHIDDAGIALIHITPSGHGMRIVTRMDVDEYDSREDYCAALISRQRAVADTLNLADFGDVDECVKDLSRLSFVPKADEILFINGDVLFHPSNITINDQNTGGGSIREPHEHSETSGEHSDVAGAAGSANHDAGGNDRSLENENFKYGDFLVRDIAAEYVKWKGEPVDGTRHNFYNRMVLDFRSICNNSPEILAAVLPRFEESFEKRYSQCKSICRKNDTTKIPTVFWIWLKEKGYYVRTEADPEDIDDNADPYAEWHALIDRMPTLPPVFREIVGSAPREFKIPTLFALLPVMGTVATHLQAEYYDGEIHTPSFFTVICAPPGSGKSFVNRFLQLDIDRSTETNLLHEIVQRDYIANARMNLWNEFSNTKGANDKGKSRPKVSTRLAETITSQADLLPVMKDNQGMHMFMFAPEIDTLIKGMKAGGGGDKNDIFRVAWDNGMYGQSYRNSISFRGKVAMYLNVLTTGTPGQCKRMFKDVENGLVSRCLFTDLGQQEFAKFQPWKSLTKKDLLVIDNWRRRCDSGTYKQSLNFDLSQLDDYADEESFDENVPWEYKFNGRTTVDLSWFNKELLKWLENERQIAEKNADHSRDTFRKRAAGNAFRVALLSTSCWKKVTKREQAIIKDFALYVADVCLYMFQKFWGAEFNAVFANGAKALNGKVKLQATLYDALPDEFTRGELEVKSKKCNIATDVYNIVHRWVNAGLITKTGKNAYKKKRP